MTTDILVVNVPPRYNPRHLAVETLEVLIEAGANVNATNQIAKMTPLHCAIRFAIRCCFCM